MRISSKSVMDDFGVTVGTSRIVWTMFTYVGFIAVERGDGELERRHATGTFDDND